MNQHRIMKWGLRIGVLVVLSGIGCGSSGSNSASGSSNSVASTTSGSSTGATNGNATTGSSAGAGTTGGGTTGGTVGGSTTGGSSTGTACLDPSPFASAFTIADTAFCAVAIYTADEAAFSMPSWGSHHGPLVVTQAATDGGVTLERWSVQPGTSALTKQSTYVSAVVPDMAYLGGQANDLPFFGWTTVFWTGPSPVTTGSIAAIASGAVAESYTVNGPYWVAGISDGQGQGRLLYTGLSPLGMPATTTNGLYAADACSLPMQELGAGTGCSASALISAWDETPGPVAVDKGGNAFAVLNSFSTGNQDARGFLAANVARGQGATPGVPLFTLDGHAGGLAAITPTSTTTGLLVFQPFDATTSDALDIVEQAYTAGTDIAPMGTPTTLLQVPAGTSTGLSFMTDDTDRLWVAFTGASSTTYVVLARVP